MYAMFLFVVLTVSSLLECADAHGYHHPAARDQDPSFDNIVEQKYPTLDSLEPSFVAMHRRKLATDLSRKVEQINIGICEPKCYLNPDTKKWLSCDDLV